MRGSGDKIIRMLLRRSLPVLLLLFFATETFCQEIEWGKNSNLLVPFPQYVIYQTNSKVTIDGKANEPDWNRLEWMSDFGDIRGSEWPKPFLDTRVKIMWDTQNLYVYAELEEPDLEGEMLERDELLFNENNFEIFIDPDGDAHNYYEFEVNVLNTLFDLILTKPYRDKGTALFTWDAPGFQSAVDAKGTINKPNDVDKNWNVEMKIPFADLRSGAAVKIPKNGDTWKVNLMRIEWEGGNAADKAKKTDGIKTHYWTWSPQGFINMHSPETWGMVQFSDKKAGAGKVQFEMPQSEELKKYLWLVYHRQTEFKRTHGKYAATLEEISIPGQIATEIQDGRKATIRMWATPKQFTVEIEDGDNLISLNETGLLSERRK